MKKFLLIFVCVALLSACDENTDLKTTSGSYLPLQVGNSWRFESTNPAAKDGFYFKRVMDTVTLNEHTYYEIVSGWSTSTEDIQDVAYYRVDDDGFVYILRLANNYEENRFRLNATDGDTWSYLIDDNDTAVISLTVSPLTIGSKELKDCKKYFYNVENWADEEYTITLAKGIGFVKEHSDAWGQGSILKSATINGQEINF